MFVVKVFIICPPFQLTGFELKFEWNRFFSRKIECVICDKNIYTYVYSYASFTVLKLYINEEMNHQFFAAGRKTLRYVKKKLNKKTRNCMNDCDWILCIRFLHHAFLIRSNSYTMLWQWLIACVCALQSIQ